MYAAAASDNDGRGRRPYAGADADFDGAKPQKDPKGNAAAGQTTHDSKILTNKGNASSRHTDRQTDKDRPRGQIRVLVAESNHDLRYLYQTYLESFGLDMEIVDGGKACLNRLYGNTENNTNFDVVIINTHLSDAPGLDIAKEIHKKNPGQRIVITTTILTERLPREQLDSAGVDREYVLTIPFRFSDMMYFLSKWQKP
jgi:CheY-like chemotaxis protein